MEKQRLPFPPDATPQNLALAEEKRGKSWGKSVYE